MTPSRLIALGFGLGLLACILTIAIVDAAHGQVLSKCGSRQGVAYQLRTRYFETHRAGGTVGDRALIDLFVSDEKQTWTLVVTDARGLSCILAAGQSWTEEPPAKPGRAL